MTNPLFDQTVLASVNLPNRLVVAPLTRTSASDDGVPTQRMIEYYRDYALGEFGLIITEGTYTDLAYAQGYLNQPGLVTEAQVVGWGKVTHAVHAAGAKIFTQLMHAGAQNQGNIYAAGTVGPSAVRPRGEKLAPYGAEGAFDVPSAMTQRQIDEAIEGFVTSAKNAVIAGFDGIEIHGANGYLIDEFMTDYFNQRDDAYGGSIKNRARLAVEVIEAVKAAVPGGFPVGIRISQLKTTDNDYRWENGLEVLETVLPLLKAAGADFIHVSDYQASEPAFGSEHETFVGAVKRLSGLPTLVAGHLEDPSVAEAMVRDQQTDFVVLGKGAIADPAWPVHVRQGQDIVPFTPALFSFGPTLEGVDKARAQAEQPAA